MSTLDDIYDTVDGIVHDPTWDSDKVIQLFNAGIGYVSSLVLLPELETIGTVTTSISINHVSLPTNYQRKLRDCINITRPFRRIRMFGSVPLLNRHFSRLDIAGPIIGIAVMGRSLYYQRIPSAPETLQINYFAKPTELDGSESPDVLPAFADDLLLNYACWKIYSVIEEGMDGVKTQTKFYEGQFATYLNQLGAFIGPEHTRPFHIKDELFEQFNAGAWA